MFLSLLKFFRGFLLVRLQGYAPERFLNLCSNHNILIWNLVHTKGSYEFNISIAGYRSLTPLLKKTKTKVHIKKRIGLPFFLYRYRKRKIFFVGILFCVGFLVYLSQFIWMIDINGNSAVTDNTILGFLKNQHSYFGNRLSRIDCETLEESLRSEFDEIIWASVQLNGTKMTIDLQENLVTSQGKNDIQGEYDIVADKDAQIDSIVTRAGTPQVKAGVLVKKGDILVSGRLDILNDSNEISAYEYVTSDADILGKTSYRFEEKIKMQETQKIKTGESQKKYAIEIFGHYIKFPSAKKKQEPFILVSESRQLALCRNYYIPVIFEETTIYPCRLEKVHLSKEQAKAKAESKLSLFLNKLQEKGIQITDKNVMINFINNTCYVQADITALEKIGKYQPTEIIKISTDEGIENHESD